MVATKDLEVTSSNGNTESTPKYRAIFPQEELRDD